jgi:hypothetical protein
MSQKSSVPQVVSFVSQVLKRDTLRRRFSGCEFASWIERSEAHPQSGKYLPF